MLTITSMIILRNKLCVLRRWTAEQRSTAESAAAEIRDHPLLSYANTYNL